MAIVVTKIIVVVVVLFFAVNSSNLCEYSVLMMIHTELTFFLGNMIRIYTFLKYFYLYETLVTLSLSYFQIFKMENNIKAIVPFDLLSTASSVNDFTKTTGFLFID